MSRKEFIARNKRRMEFMKQIVWYGMALVFLAAWAAAAMAQQYPGNGQGPGPMMQGDQERTLSPEQFAERKTRVLQLLEERRQRIEQEKACVEASKDIEAMRKCRPEPQRSMGRGGYMPGGQGQRPPMGGMQ
jgi:hypothetical protein